MAGKQAKKGDKVSIEYTGKLETGEIFDTSKGREPLQFELGAEKSSEDSSRPSWA